MKKAAKAIFGTILFWGIVFGGLAVADRIDRYETKAVLVSVCDGLDCAFVTESGHEYHWLNDPEDPEKFMHCDEGATYVLELKDYEDGDPETDAITKKPVLAE